jgi:hypothetical protein
MVRRALAELVPDEEIESSERKSGGAGITGPLAALGLSGHADIKREVRRRPTDPSSPDHLARVLAEHGKTVLFLDDFENVYGQPHEEATTHSVRRLIKSLADSGEVTLVVAGIPKAGSRLIDLDQAAIRRVADIEVPRMDRGELDQILVSGAERLRISFVEEVRQEMVTYSDGFPAYTHAFGLHSARLVLRESGHVVRHEHFDLALPRIIADRDSDLGAAYNAAVEHGMRFGMRQRVLETIAQASVLEIPVHAIIADIQRNFPGADVTAEVTQSLVELTESRADEWFGPILTSSGKEQESRFRFSDPLMRAYVWMKMRAGIQRTTFSTPGTNELGPLDPSQFIG